MNLPNARKDMKTYLISHTHWDREWYQTFQDYRARLIVLLDELIAFMGRTRRSSTTTSTVRRSCWRTTWKYVRRTASGCNGWSNMGGLSPVHGT